LAQAYLQRKMAALPKPTKVEITDYYRNNPELFAQRKLFELKHVMVSTTDFTPEVKAATDSAKSVDEMENWLGARKIKFVKDQSNRTTADLPPNLLGQLNELAKGKPFIMKDASNVLVATLAFIKDVPVPEEAAYAQIERFLANKKMQQAATNEVARLRKEATIVFLHEQGSPQNATEKTSEPQAGLPSKPEGQTDNKHIERGVSGLK